MNEMDKNQKLALTALHNKNITCCFAWPGYNGKKVEKFNFSDEKKFKLIGPDASKYYFHYTGKEEMVLSAW